jgi:hypothetical protein
LGQGVYSLSEVARYADLNPSTMRAWFKGRSDGVGRGPVFRSDYSAVNKDFAVSFLDLVDACVAGRFRRAGVKLSIVREAYRLLTDDLKTPHPFAHDLLYTDGRAIIVGVANRVNNPLPYDAISKQILFDDIGSIRQVDYREADHLAWRWRIAEGVEIDRQLLRQARCSRYRQKPGSCRDSTSPTTGTPRSWRLCSESGKTT